MNMEINKGIFTFSQELGIVITRSETIDLSTETAALKQARRQLGELPHEPSQYQQPRAWTMLLSLHIAYCRVHTSQKKFVLNLLRCLYKDHQRKNSTNVTSKRSASRSRRENSPRARSPAFSRSSFTSSETKAPIMKQTAFIPLPLNIHEYLDDMIEHCRDLGSIAHSPVRDVWSPPREFTGQVSATQWSKSASECQVEKGSPVQCAGTFYTSSRYMKRLRFFRILRKLVQRRLEVGYSKLRVTRRSEGIPIPLNIHDYLDDVMNYRADLQNVVYVSTRDTWSVQEKASTTTWSSSSSNKRHNE